MKFERNEILTGLLLVTTVGLLVGVILLLSAPGFFKAQDRYQIFFDNAAGVKTGCARPGRGPADRASRRHPGAGAEVRSVLPSTRRTRCCSPCASTTAPWSTATPPRACCRTVLLGEQVIDFVGGTEDSGNAPSNYKFVGERVPDLNSALPKIPRGDRAPWPAPPP